VPIELLILPALTNFFFLLVDSRVATSKATTEQRSINLAISHRGIAALEAIEPAAAQRFLQSSIPMHGRMIHKLSGELDSQLYDRDGQVRKHLYTTSV
jgi:kynurenine 3-monooxygenase